MSKAFGMAGLRLGYLAAAQELVDHLRVVRLPYHLSALTQAAALAALRHREELMGQVASLRAERDALVVWLRGQGLEVADSDANFVLFGRFDDRSAVWQGLLERGVLIREVGPDGWLRVSVGTPEETAAFRAALVEVLGR
jgi:histidinol-phosphate aminotransferase